MDPVTKDPLLYFSNEISLQILRYFSPKQLALISSVSALWNTISQDNTLWKDLALNYFYSVSQDAEKIAWKELLKKNITQIRNIVPRTISSLPPFAYHQAVFYFSINRSIFLSKSDTYNPFDDKSRTKYETGHQKVITCMQLLESNSKSSPFSLITASEDATIKIFSTEKLDCQQTLIGHTKPITCLKLLAVDPMQFKGSLALLFSGSLDGTVRIWEVTKKVTKAADCQILKEEPSVGESSQSCIDGISALEVTEEGYNNYAVFSGSVTGKILIWDIYYRSASIERKIDFKKIFKVSDAHQAKITAIKQTSILSTGKTIATASLDKTIKIWFYQWMDTFPINNIWGYSKKASMDCIQVIDAGVPITHLDLQGCALVSAAMDGSIKLWCLDYRKEFELLKKTDLIKEEILYFRSYQHVDMRMRNSIESIIFVVNRSNVFFVGSTGYRFDFTPTIPELQSFQYKAT